MKRFQFDLEPVLKVKKSREEILEKQLAGLLVQKAKIKGSLAHLSKAVEELQAYQKQRRLQKLINLAEERIFQGKLGDYQFQVDENRKQLAALEVLIEKKRCELVQASKEKQSLEKLEERRHREYLIALNREEQAFLDEIAQHQFLMNRRTGVA